MTVGRVSGHRGGRGEITVRASDAEIWTPVGRFWIEPPGRPGAYREVETSRAYRDRLVLKLRGIDDASQAAGLRGATVAVDEDVAPEPPPGTFVEARLVGLRVVAEADGRELGRVAGVLPTGGVDVLRVVTRGAPPSRELLVPLAPEIVRNVDYRERRIVVRLPSGLDRIND